MHARSRSGNVTYIMAAMLIIGVSVFAIFSYNVMKRRRFDQLSIERYQSLMSLKYRLETAMRSTDFIETNFIKANPPIENYLKAFTQSLNDHAEAPPFIDDKSIRILDGEGKTWLGGGIGHRRGDLATCVDGAKCPITSAFETSLEIQGTMIIVHLTFSISTNNIEQTGPINSSKPENQFTVAVPINYYGNEWSDHSVQCRSGFRAIQITAPPMELLCVATRMPVSL